MESLLKYFLPAYLAAYFFALMRCAGSAVLSRALPLV
jgi:hypothetical protein